MKKVKSIAVVILIALSVCVISTQCVKKIVNTSGSINGIVTDSSTGEPINNVSITLSPSGKTISTGSDGAYEIIDLEPLQYKIQAMHSSYKTNTKTVTVISGEIIRGDIQMTKK
jgi:hypothetical protein